MCLTTHILLVVVLTLASALAIRGCYGYALRTSCDAAGG